MFYRISRAIAWKFHNQNLASTRMEIGTYHSVPQKETVSQEICSVARGLLLQDCFPTDLWSFLVKPTWSRTAPCVVTLTTDVHQVEPMPPHDVGRAWSSAGKRVVAAPFSCRCLPSPLMMNTRSAAYALNLTGGTLSFPKPPTDRFGRRESDRRETTRRVGQSPRPGPIQNRWMGGKYVTDHVGWLGPVPEESGAAQLSRTEGPFSFHRQLG